LTGATGLVGRYLVRDLLLDGHRLALLVRPSQKQSARERGEVLLQMWERELDCSLPRPICLEGDVTEPGCGLSSAACRWAAEHCDRVIHNAAVLTFNTDQAGEPWRTNVEGTRNLLQLCKKLKLHDLHYVSTAYVCGLREGRILENELDKGQKFRNDYEVSKFQAEQMVRQADFLDCLTVYRPAVIAGDSRTGYTSTYHALYLYLKLVAVMLQNEQPDANGMRETAIRLKATGDEARNIVPVDWVSAVMCRLFNTPAAEGGTYHLAPRAPLTTREFIDFTSSYFKTEGVQYVSPDTVLDADGTDFEKYAYANSSIYQSYATTDPTFDTTNLRKFTADLPCPKLDEAMLHRFAKYGEQDRWGKRRPEKPVVEFWAGEYLQGTVAPHARHASSERRRWIGLDISGPGGGQWGLMLSGATPLALEQGLPGHCAAILKLSNTEFLELVRGQTGWPARALKQALRPVGQLIGAELVHSVLLALFPASVEPVPALPTNGHAPVDPMNSPVRVSAKE